MQENEDHQNHESHGLEEGLHDFLHAVGDRQRGIERDGVLEAVREKFGLLFEESASLFHGVHGVRAGELVDRDNAGALALEAATDVIDLPAEFHARDILHPHNRAVGISANHDVFEFLDRGEATRGGYRVGENLALRNRFTADLTGGVHLVLRADCLNDLGHGDVQRGEAVGLHPNAHRVFARAEDAHAADAGNAGERVVEVDVGVVRQEGRVDLAVGG